MGKQINPIISLRGKTVAEQCEILRELQKPRATPHTPKDWPNIRRVVDRLDESVQTFEECLLALNSWGEKWGGNHKKIFVERIIPLCDSFEKIRLALPHVPRSHMDQRLGLIRRACEFAENKEQLLQLLIELDCLC